MEVKARWKENYQELYNEQNPVIEEATISLPIIVTDETEPRLLKDEVESAINPRLTKGGGGGCCNPPYGFSPVALKR